MCGYLRVSPRTAFWVVDPIDRAANFASGIAHYAIVMANVSNGWIELVAIYNAEVDELSLATRGKRGDAKRKSAEVYNDDGDGKCQRGARLVEPAGQPTLS